MSDHLRKRACALSILLVIALGVVGCAPNPAPTKTDGPSTSVTSVGPVVSDSPSGVETSAVVADETVDQAVRWIVEAWENDPVAFADIETLSNTVIALSAADTVPGTITTMLGQLQLKGQNLLGEDDPNPAELAIIIVAAEAANQNPQNFLGCDVDAVEELQAMMDTEAGREAILDYGRPYVVGIALYRGGAPIPEWLVTEMLKRQYGGFHQVFGDAVQEIDPFTTALGISVMTALRRSDVDAETRQEAEDSLTAAISWAEDPANQQQDAGSGGFRWSDDLVATGMLTAALGDVLTVGTFPGAEPDIAAPLLYLKAQQLQDGGWPGVHDGGASDLAATLASLLGVVGNGYSSAHTDAVPEMTDCPA